MSAFEEGMYRSLATRSNAPLILIFGAFLIALVLVPFVSNGLWFDDSLNSQIWALLNRYDVSLWNFSLLVTKTWISAGRLLLGWIWVYGFFYLFTEPLAVRMANAVLLLANIGAAALLLRRAGAAWSTVGLFVVILFSLFQIRFSHDPVAAYASVLPLLGLTLTASLFWLLRWTEGGSRWELASASVLVFISMLIYEITIIYFAIATIVVWTSSRQQRYRSIVVMLLPLLVFVTVSAAVRIKATSSYDGSAVGQLLLIFPTYLKQWTATFPVSFYFFRLSSTIPLLELMLSTLTNWVSCAITLVGYLTALLVLRGANRSIEGHFNKPLRGVTLVASALFFLTPLLIAVSSKYQRDLVFGEAHIPVYFQYFGLALLMALGISHLMRSEIRAIRPAVTMLFPLALAMCVACTWTVNMRQKSYLDSVFAEPRESLSVAIDHGLLSPVRDGDVLTLVNLPIFITGNLIFQLSGKNLSFVNDPVGSGFYSIPARQDARYFSLLRDSSDNNAWKVNIRP